MEIKKLMGFFHNFNKRLKMKIKSMILLKKRTLLNFLKFFISGDLLQG